MVSLAAWIEWKGVRAPTAHQLGAIYCTQASWVSAVYDVWPDCSGGRVIDDAFVQRAVEFWHHIRKLHAIDMAELAVSSTTATEVLKKLQRRLPPVVL